MITAIGFVDKFVELRKPSRRHGPCCNQKSPKAEESNLQAKVFSKNSNLNYYNIILYYGGSLSSYAGVDYYNILKLGDWCITARATEFGEIVGRRCKYFICHKNFVSRCFLLP